MSNRLEEFFSQGNFTFNSELVHRDNYNDSYYHDKHSDRADDRYFDSHYDDTSRYDDSY